MWLKLENLNMTKSLANCLCMKQLLYTFKIREDMNRGDQIDEFTRILDGLENHEVKLEEDKALYHIECFAEVL